MSLPTPKASILTIAPYKQGKSAKDPSVRQIKLSSNENPYGPSPQALAAYDAASKSLPRYPDGAATALRQAIGEVHGIDPERILCGAGSDELIGLLVAAYAGPGDEVLFTEHAFLMYSIYTRAAGATPVEARETERRADIDALLSSVTERTKIVFLANPNNPTGTHIGNAELRRLRDGLPEHVILAVDAAYAECVTDADCPDGQALALSTGNTVMLRTFSKVYGLPALRLGWMAGPPAILDAINRIRSPFNVGQVAQDTGAAAVRDVAYTDKMRKANASERTRVAEAVAALGWHPMPSQGNFLLIDFGDAETATAVNAHLLQANIFIREVGAYKLPTCLRMTIGTPEENDAVLASLRDFAA